MCLNELLNEKGVTTNCYLTKYYIVVQKLQIVSNSLGQKLVVSNDIYFERNCENEVCYRKHFTVNGCLYCGKRVKTDSYIRQYIAEIDEDDFDIFED